MEDRKVLLSVKDLIVKFHVRGRVLTAIRGVSLDIYENESIAIVGESGSGKTTIGRAVIRVNPLANGEILYKGVRISGKIPKSLDREVIRNIQMVFQDPVSFP